MPAIATVAANCWLSAATTFGVPAELLYSIAEVESGFRPTVVANANDGSRSVGVMQINSVWFPKLAEAGITEKDLREPCVNIHVGAWILSKEVQRYGPTWEAIGAYYAGPYDAGRKAWRLKHYHGYASRVLRAWERLNARAEKLGADGVAR